MMLLQPDITIVIVNYNGFEFTAQCLASIYEHSPLASLEIIVVDNASKDDSADLLEKKFTAIKLVRSTENRGIAGGNNLGIRAGSGRYVLLLNNDTLVLPGMIDCAKEFLNSNTEAGGVGGNLVNPDGSYQSGAWPFPSLVEEFLQLSKLGCFLRKSFPSYPPYKEPCQVDWMSTAFMLFRRDALEGVDLVDENYFIYSDETDLEYRMWKAGWKLYYLPEVKTVHFGGKSLEPWRSRKLKYRGRLLFWRKHGHPLEEAVVRAMYVGSSFLKLGFWSVTYLIPRYRRRAAYELRSQFDIFKLSLWPVLPPALPSKG
jgi:N-acetylglucosaminyl-diphospho-decaprenol L-rhamnosyltransferase